jgi:hypothetical protein
MSLADRTIAESILADYPTLSAGHLIAQLTDAGFL